MPNEYKNTEEYRSLMGVNAAYKEMVEEKMLLGCEIVTSDYDEKIHVESARENYRRVYK